MKEVYIYDAVRTPRGSVLPTGHLYEFKPIHLIDALIRAIQDRGHVSLSEIEEFAIGIGQAVGPQGGNMARTIALFGGLDHKVPAIQFSGDETVGLQALFNGFEAIQSNRCTHYLAGGLESNSRMDAKWTNGPLKFDPEVSLKTGYIPGGISADLLATIHEFDQSDLNTYTIDSIAHAQQSIADLKFRSYLVPIHDQNGLDIQSKDYCHSDRLDLEELANQKPAYRELGAAGFNALALEIYPEIGRIIHQHLAWHTAPLADGAGLIALGSHSESQNPIARIHSFVICGSEPRIRFGGATKAAQQAIKEAGLEHDSIQVWESDEPFAAAGLYFRRFFNLEPKKHNHLGGDLAWGQAGAASGLMQICTALSRLKKTNQQYACVAMNGLSGMGAACVIEYLNP